MKKIIIYTVSALSIGVIGYTAYLVNRSEIPKNAVPIKDFDLNRYLGQWYEIARLDFKFQENLVDCAALYTLNKNGSVLVLNSGYDTINKKWIKAEGTAKFRGSENEGKLKVSFFGPFYSGYNVVALDKDYQYALVFGRNIEFMWILSRTKDIPEDVKNNYLEIAKKTGYDTSKLIWSNQKRNDNPYTKK